MNEVLEDFLKVFQKEILKNPRGIQEEILGNPWRDFLKESKEDFIKKNPGGIREGIPQGTLRGIPRESPDKIP